MRMGGGGGGGEWEWQIPSASTLNVNDVFNIRANGMRFQVFCLDFYLEKNCFDWFVFIDFGVTMATNFDRKKTKKAQFTWGQ